MGNCTKLMEEKIYMYTGKLKICAKGVITKAKNAAFQKSKNIIFRKGMEGYGFGTKTHLYFELMEM
jgi:hypothetical protein